MQKNGIAVGVRTVRKVTALVTSRFASSLSDLRRASEDTPELLAGGTGIRGPFPPSDTRYGWFQTLVQADGDLCLGIHADALTLPSFEEDIRQHIGHVQRELVSLDWAHRVLRNLHWAIGGVAGLVSIVELIVSDKALFDMLLRDVTVISGLVILFLARFLQPLVLRAAAGIFRFLMLRRFRDLTPNPSDGATPE